ncbi:MAG: biotin/lipoyl-binding protein, partial [Caldimonas sp.]
MNASTASEQEAVATPLPPLPPVPAPRPARSWKQRLRLPLMLFGPIVVAVVAAYVYLAGGRYESTDDAYVQAARVAISANVAGRVSELDVRENQLVHKGDLLFRLDDAPFRIAVDEASAQLATARLQIDSLKANYRQRQTELTSAQDTL